jgi:3-hydroxyacyl-CoA dehydrogenase-like protein
MSAQKIGVIGGGLMGHGIAYLLAAAGHAIGVFEPTPEIRATLSKRLRVIADLFGDDPALLENVSAHDQLAPAVAGASFVFEAAPEKLPLKQKIFADSKVQSRRIRSWPAIHRRFRPPRSGVISNIVSVSSARIFGIRRTSSRSWK